jgi:pantoate--beta-alanine ligase
LSGAILTSVTAMQASSKDARSRGKTIALVPTMGALHEGHLSLIRKAKSVADHVVTSVFVNPTQFGKGEDFERYPRDLDRDAEMAFSSGSDILFAPAALEMSQGFRLSCSGDSLTSSREEPGRGIFVVSRL